MISSQTPNKRTRIAFDTNVLISATINKQSSPFLAFIKAVQHCDMVSSLSGVEELSGVILREKFNRYSSLESRKKFLHSLILSSEIIATTSQHTLCRDPKDNHWLDLAAQAELDILVTGDRDLLALHPFQKTQILTPSQFLAL